MNYDEIKASLADLLNRNDLTDEIPGFIILAEAQMNRDIRHWRMENRATLNTVDRYPGLPDDWLETQRLTNPDNNLPLELISRQAMSELRFASNDGDGYGEYGPRYFRHSQNGFELFPSPGVDGMTLELEYYTRIPQLGIDDGNGVRVTNWVSDLHPDVYLYGAAIHSAPFLADDARINTWGSLYQKAVDKVNQTGNAAESSSSSPRMRKRGMGQTRVPNENR